MSPTSREMMWNAYKGGVVIPSFNVAYLPMVTPVVEALVDCNAVGFIAVARLEWVRFEAQSQEAVRREYARHARAPWTRLHQDHVPVVDEDGEEVEFVQLLRRAVDLGYDSIMVDGSRLPLTENIRATRRVVEMAAPHSVPVEGELGAVMGHEAGPLPPYEALLASGRGFTDVDEAARFVEETGVDWLSVACGNIHGAIRGSAKDRKKAQARLDIDHLARLRDATDVPLVLHGGSGIARESIQAGIANGIAKINIGTDVRQPYEQALRAGQSIGQARAIVYAEVRHILADVLEVVGSRDIIAPVPAPQADAAGD
jgi:ketose-bisphosphate aldolase